MVRFAHCRCELVHYAAIHADVIMLCGLTYLCHFDIAYVFRNRRAMLLVIVVDTSIAADDERPPP